MDVGLGALLRGGNWNNGSNSGVFTANLNNDPSNTNTNIGFRCVFRPARLGYHLCRGGNPQLRLTLWLRVTTKTKALRPSTRAGLRGHYPERSKWAHDRHWIPRASTMT
jgi:hypothetical protein